MSPLPLSAALLCNTEAFAERVREEDSVEKGPSVGKAADGDRCGAANPASKAAQTYSTGTAGPHITSLRVSPVLEASGCLPGSGVPTKPGSPRIQQVILSRCAHQQVPRGSLRSRIIDAAGIQERSWVGNGRWEGHGCERGGNRKAALVLLNSCSQGTPLAGWGAPGIRFQQTSANEHRSSLRGAGSAPPYRTGGWGHRGSPAGKELRGAGTELSIAAECLRGSPHVPHRRSRSGRTKACPSDCRHRPRVPPRNEQSRRPASLNLERNAFMLTAHSSRTHWSDSAKRVSLKKVTPECSQKLCFAPINQTSCIHDVFCYHAC
ncbi:uncharacterized protein LOC122184349 [Lagopus leucura]|uniref:uncharacterized protein LOC122184349 n=1 Tax=Lagopus leucura TaxID=30410 RepID=UPI001C67306D|nr:uncharacterized protein LOC122184349 [Lagopus leucura]